MRGVRARKKSGHMVYFVDFVVGKTKFKLEKISENTIKWQTEGHM